MRSKTVSSIIVLTGLILGGFLGEVSKNITYLGWLNFGKTIGIPSFQVDLYIVQINFGLTFNCTIASIIGLILGLIIYFKIVK